VTSYRKITFYKPRNGNETILFCISFGFTLAEKTNLNTPLLLFIMSSQNGRSWNLLLASFLVQGMGWMVLGGLGLGNKGPHIPRQQHSFFDRQKETEK
jgi:hypothetical protein